MKHMHSATDSNEMQAKKDIEIFLKCHIIRISEPKHTQQLTQIILHIYVYVYICGLCIHIILYTIH